MPAQPPSSAARTGRLPGVQNARPAPDEAKISLFVQMGRGFKTLGEEMMKGVEARSDQLAIAKAMIKQAQQASKGFGNQGPQTPDSQGGPGGQRRPADGMRDPLSGAPISATPGGQGNQPFNPSPF